MLLLSTFARRVTAVARARRTYHHGNLRRALLDVALARFVARGELDFTLRELAREVGVTHNAPYRHFAGKGELFAALRDEGFAALAKACREALAEAGDDPRARIRALGEAYVRTAVADPHRFRLMSSDPRVPAEAAAPPRDAFVMLHDAVEAARRAGVVRDDLSAREIALGAWALVHGLASLVVEGHLPADDARLRRRVRLLDTLFFEGATARPAPQRRSSS